MHNLLLKLKGNPSFNRSLFPPKIYIYDDLLVYHSGNPIKSHEITVAYIQISKVHLTRGLLFAGMEIETTGGDLLQVRYVNKHKATLAKKIIDQKIYMSHPKHLHSDQTTTKTEVMSYEKSLNRLKELHAKGHISDRELARRKSEITRKFTITVG